MRVTDKLFSELRRRNVFRVAGVYAVVAWIVMQVIAVMTPALELPGWVDGFFAVLLIAGFPIAMILAWAFEMTPEGVKLTANVPEGESIAPKTGRRLDYAIIGGIGAGRGDDRRGSSEPRAFILRDDRFAASSG